MNKHFPVSHSDFSPIYMLQCYIHVPGGSWVNNRSSGGAQNNTRCDCESVSRGWRQSAWTGQMKTMTGQHYTRQPGEVTLMSSDSNICIVNSHVAQTKIKTPRTFVCFKHNV